ncbi:hypothetical protein O206_02745 [Ochrobactrum sp. EGD-AQ16]|nr:hypothetical protein O206_02745 [Ochrobactrum sp. EGD-AQ16]
MEIGPWGECTAWMLHPLVGMLQFDDFAIKV